MRSIASRYGASPGHFIGHVLLLGLTAWALSHVVDLGNAHLWFIWFIGAALLHDLVVLPVYSALDLGLVAATGGRRPRDVPRARKLLLDHVRAPVAVSAVLLLVTFPLVLQRAPGNYTRVAGIDPNGYLASWVGIVVGLFLLSAVVYAIRLARAPGPELFVPDPPEPAGPPAGPPGRVARLGGAALALSALLHVVRLIRVDRR